MFKVLVIILFWDIILSITTQAQVEKLKSIRSDFERNKDNPSQCLMHIKKLENAHEPEIKGYQAMYMFMMAQHSSDLFSKWSYFHKGKKLLEEVISQNPDNIELKFLRFMIQTNIPAILGYNTDIHTDKKELMYALTNKKIIDTDLEQRIKQLLKKNSYLTEKEKQIL